MKIDFMLTLVVAIFLPTFSPAQAEITYRGEPAFDHLNLSNLWQSFPYPPEKMNF
jgi:hypothetical protein